MSDLISRQKTIKTIYFYFEDLIIALPKIVDSDGEKTVDISKINEYLEMYKAIRELITILPSEKPRAGKWIKDRERFGDNAYHCSQCGAVLEKDNLEWRNNYYCYHCGADMRGEQDEID